MEEMRRQSFGGFAIVCLCVLCMHALLITGYTLELVLSCTCRQQYTCVACPYMRFCLSTL